MIKAGKAMRLLIAEDDPDDRLLVAEAIDQVHQGKNYVFVEDGEQLLDYLLKKEIGTDQDAAPFVIIVDLNMPKKDGRQAIREIKGHPRLKNIPIVVLTTSMDDSDILAVYELGVSSYIRKPASFDDLKTIVQTLIRYWSEIVELPLRYP
jgi:two-component system, response regulator